MRFAARGGQKGVASSAGILLHYVQIRDAGWWEVPRVSTQCLNDWLFKQQQQESRELVVAILSEMSLSYHPGVGFLSPAPK